MPPTTTTAPDGWHYHVGTTPAQRHHLRRFMHRRRWWALTHHQWPSLLTRLGLGGALIALAHGACQQARHAPLTTVVLTAVLTGAACMVVVGAVAVLLGAAVPWWRLRPGRTRWVAHWCQGPHGETAIRFTRPHPPAPYRPERWPGMDFYGEHGAGKRLLHWLQTLVDDRDAILIIHTRSPKLVAYYQNAGLTLTRQPRLRCGSVQFGKTVLTYPPRPRSHAARQPT